MASTEEYLAYALDLLREAPAVTHRKMMGEYLLYSEGFIIGGITTTDCCSRTYPLPANLSRARTFPTKERNPCCS